MNNIIELIDNGKHNKAFAILLVEYIENKYPEKIQELKLKYNMLFLKDTTKNFYDTTIPGYRKFSVWVKSNISNNLLNEFKDYVNTTTEYKYMYLKNAMYKIERTKLLKNGKVFKIGDYSLWFNEHLASMFMTKVNSIVLLERDVVFWKDVHNKKIALTINESKELIRKLLDTLDYVYFNSKI
jgi:hypothetical protein